MTITLAPETESRVLAAATRRNQAPEAVVDAALEEYLRNEPAQDEAAQDEAAQDEAAQEADDEAAYQEEQARLHALMDDLLAKAHEIVPEPYDSPTRTYYRESEVGKIIAKKFRKQGFNV